ncbi:MAG: cytochrome c biogenesis CcdA family protein [Candidatus Binatia bacterium]
MPGAENINILVAMAAGLLSFLSPCVLPLFPSYLSFITGISFDESGAGETNPVSRRVVMLNSIMFVLGFSLIFISLGASFSLLGKSLLSYQTVIFKVGGVIVIVFGLYIMGLLKIPAFMRYKQFQLKNKPAGYVGSAVVGAAFGAGWTPCVGPILGAILTLAVTSGKVSSGVTLLSAYSLGLAVPFLVSSFALGSFMKFYVGFRKRIKVFHIIGGILLVIVGFLLITDYFTILSGIAARWTPAWLLERL